MNNVLPGKWVYPIIMAGIFLLGRADSVLRAQEENAATGGRSSLVIPADDEGIPQAIPVTEEGVDATMEVPEGEIPQAIPIHNSGYDGLPMDPSRPIRIQILSPRPDEVVGSQDVDIFLDLDNYKLAENGNRVHVIVDNQPPIVRTDIAAPISLKNISEGGHSVRAMVVKPDGTWLHDEGCFVMVHFYVKKKDFQNFVDPKLPFLTVNLPMNETVMMDEEDRILFDYRIHVPEGDKGAYKVRYKMEGYDGFIEQTQGPVLWSNITPGRHQLTVELFEKSGKPVFGIFNRVERTFEVRKVLKAAPVDPEAPPTTGMPNEML